MKHLRPSRTVESSELAQRVRELEDRLARIPVRFGGGGSGGAAPSYPAARISVTNGQELEDGSGVIGIKKVSGLVVLDDYPFHGGEAVETVIAIPVTAVGSGYTSATVSFSGGGGSDAAGSAVIVDGKVVAVNITNAGTGYTSAPTVTITSGSGTGATATAIVSTDPITTTFPVAWNDAGNEGIGYGSANTILGGNSPSGVVLIAHDDRSAAPFAILQSRTIATFFSGNVRLATEDADARGCVEVWIPQGEL